MCGISHTLTAPAIFMYLFISLFLYLFTFLFIYLFLCLREQSVSIRRVDWVPLAKERIARLTDFVRRPMVWLPLTGDAFWRI